MTSPEEGRGDGESTRSWWKKLLGIGLASGAVVFLGLHVHRNWRSLNDYAWHLDPWTAGLSVLVLLASFIWGTQLWRMVVRRMRGTPPDLVSLCRVWFLSSLARYVPGKIWQFVGAAGLVDRERMSAPLTGASLLVHMGFILASACLAAVILGPVERLGPGWVEWALPTITAAAIVAALHPRPLSSLLDRAAAWSGWEEIRWRGGWSDAGMLLAGGLMSWLIQGTGLWLLAISLTDLTLSSLPTLVGINALAFAGGYLTLVVPAGLGVREAILTLLLTGLLPAGPAALLAVASRLWTVVGELTGALLFELGWRLTRTPADRPVTETGPRALDSRRTSHGDAEHLD